MAVTFDSDELTSYGDAECAAMLYEVFDLYSRYQELLKPRRQAKLESLKAAHEVKVKERRTHGETLRKLEAQAAEIQSTDQELTNAESKYSFDLRVLRGQQPNPQFALASELEEYRRKEAGLEKKLAGIERQRFDLNGAKQTWEQEKEAGNQKLLKLEGEVTKLWDAIVALETGRKPTRHDPSTGLWTEPPGSVMG